MFTLIFIIGLFIILWPVIGGAITSLFNGVVLVVSGPFYWIMRLIKSPKNCKEDDRLSKIASAISMCLVLTSIFTTIIIALI